MMNGDKNTLVVDLDGTITIDDPRKEYPYKSNNLEVTNTLAKAKYNGYNVLVYTSRNMRTYKGNINLIHQYTKPIVLHWLKEHNICYDDVKFGKPWVGFSGHYVDDKNLHIEEFNIKFGSFYSDYSVDVIVSFYNEEQNIEVTHQSNKKLERLFNIKNYIYVNNCSKDKTGELLNELANMDKKVKVIHLKEDLGYGNGYKNGFQNSTSDIIITNHADLQFDAYLFFLSLLGDISQIKDIKCIFPRRIGRPIVDYFFTKILKIILSFILNTKIDEFNGQPKLIFKKTIMWDIEKFPNDFSFDLMLYCAIQDEQKLFCSVMQKQRHQGDSTWNHGWFSKYNLFKKYIKTAIKIRKMKSHEKNNRTV